MRLARPLVFAITTIRPLIKCLRLWDLHTVETLEERPILVPKAVGPLLVIVVTHGEGGGRYGLGDGGSGGEGGGGGRYGLGDGCSGGESGGRVGNGSTDLVKEVVGNGSTDAYLVLVVNGGRWW